MKRLILVILCLLAFPVVASHIVGGEFELIYVSKNRYQLHLIYYFDLNNNKFSIPPQNAQPELQEPTITVGIYRKSDDVLMRTVVLSFISKSRVSYTQPSCSHGEILTDKLLYSSDIILPDANYSDPQGYYVVWERCCRNYTITNIVSDEPAPNDANNPNAAGQTFYLEFPPVVKNGQQFINSSPTLFPPLNDYACPYRPYYADFAGQDADGDSLAYSLTVPWSTFNTLANPPLTPYPYPLVKYRPPFSFHNIMGGQPDLKISHDGLITVTPTIVGLFVFAVKIDEYRNGVKIGESRRDFQMLVTDGCAPADPPQILGKRSADAAFTYDNAMSVSFSNTVTDDNRCIQVQVSDTDSDKASENFTEHVTIKAIAIGFRKNMSGILPAVTSATLTHGSTHTFDICFDKCPPFESGDFQVGIVAYDDACSLPLTDTLKVTVHVQPPDNGKPVFTKPAAFVTQTVNEGDLVSWDIEGTDPDTDPLVLAITTDGFNLSDVGMSLTQTKLVDGLYQGKFAWDPRCDVYDFSKKTSFQVTLLLQDVNTCAFKHYDTMMFNLGIKLPGNADPVISTDLPPEQLKNGVTKKVFESLEFNVFGTDADNDLLVLSGDGVDFNFTQYNVSFPQATARGAVASHFKWDLTCDKLNLQNKVQFPFRFIVVDNANRCRLYKADTLLVNVTVLPPDNLAPTLRIVNTNPELEFTNNHQSLLVGQQISLGLFADDDDVAPQDKVSIELVSAQGNVEPQGYIFSDVSGLGAAQTTFVWNPECSIFANGVYENNYTFTFRTYDNRCFNVKADTVQVDFTIGDVKREEIDFIPPNIITPNGDGCNDFFAMEELEDLIGLCGNGDLALPHLPKDNCLGRFSHVMVFNRWGKKIFESGQRNFRWYPTNEGAGVYYYTLKYSDKEYKGVITLRY